MTMYSVQHLKCMERQETIKLRAQHCAKKMSESPHKNRAWHGMAIPVTIFYCMFGFLSEHIVLHCSPNVVLCSVTKGVKQKYLLCISVQTAYRQYIHTGSNPQDPNWLTSGESILLLLSSVSYLHSGSRIMSRSSTTTHRC